MAKHSPKILDLAKRGAEAQLRDLLHEVQMLVDLFPHLRDAFDKDELPIDFIMAKDSGALTKTGGGRSPRKPTSAATGDAASARMKKFRAGRRKVETKG